MVTQAEMLQGLRGWLGLAVVPVLRLPVWLCRAMGRLGDAMRLGPISLTAVTQLEAGVLAEPSAAVRDLPEAPRGFFGVHGSKAGGNAGFVACAALPDAAGVARGAGGAVASVGGDRVRPAGGGVFADGRRGGRARLAGHRVLRGWAGRRISLLRGRCCGGGGRG